MPNSLGIGAELATALTPYTSLLPLPGETPAAFALRVYAPGETPAQFQKRLEAVWQAVQPGLEAARASYSARLVAELLAQAPEPLPPEPSKPPRDDGWVAAVAAAERSATDYPKAWTLIRAELGAPGFPTSLRTRSLSSSDRATGAAVLRALCAAAAAEEPLIGSIDSARAAGNLGRYFEELHPSRPVEASRRNSVATRRANEGGPLALFNAIEACRMLIGVLT